MGIHTYNYNHPSGYLEVETWADPDFSRVRVFIFRHDKIEEENIPNYLDEDIVIVSKILKALGPEWDVREVDIRGGVDDEGEFYNVVYELLPSE